MTEIAANGRLPPLVAIDAPFHLGWILQRYCILLHHVAMAALTVDLGGCVFAMVKEYEFRQLVNALRRDLPLGHIDMAHFALHQSGKARAIASFGFTMARNALQL